MATGEQRTGPRPFGEELDELRRRAGVSFRELGRRANVDAGYLNHLTKGRRGHRASDAVIGRLAEALGVPADYFAEYRHRRALERMAAEVDRLYWERRDELEEPAP